MTHQPLFCDNEDCKKEIVANQPVYCLSWGRAEFESDSGEEEEFVGHDASGDEEYFCSIDCLKKTL